MFPQSQSSQMSAFIRNYTSEIPWFLTLLLVHDLHSLFASLKPILIKRTALIYDISRREYKHFESPRTENWTKIMHTKQKVWSKGPRDTQIIVCTTERNEFRLSRGLSFSLPFWTEACALKRDHQIFMVMQIPFSQSLSWRCPADQKARRLWVRDWLNSQTKYITLLASLRKWTLSYGQA